MRYALTCRLIVKMDEEKHVRSDYLDWVEQEAAAAAAAAAAADSAPAAPANTERKDSDVRPLLQPSLPVPALYTRIGSKGGKPPRAQCCIARDWAW